MGPINSKKIKSLLYKLTIFMFGLIAIQIFLYKGDLSPKYLYSLKSEKIQSIPKTSEENYFHWQKVPGTVKKFYVYSAFYDSRLKAVRIIAGGSRKIIERVLCKYSYDENSNKIDIKPTEGKVKIVGENPTMTHSFLFILCDLDPTEDIPSFVSITGMYNETDLNENINLLKINIPRKEPKYEFALCLQPIYDSDEVLRFLEWLEFNSEMGVEHFTIFDYKIGPKLRCVFKNYGENVLFLPWKLPFVSDQEMRNGGQQAAENHCLYQYKGLSKYVLSIDKDEMILPYLQDNYHDLLKYLNSLYQNASEYKIKNSLFFQSCPNDETKISIPEDPLAEKIGNKLLLIKKTIRKTEISDHYLHFKMIYDTEKVIVKGIHYSFETVPGFAGISLVNQSIASLHHYRVIGQRYKNDYCMKSPSVIDRIGHKFGKTIAIRVAQKLKTLDEKCNLT